MDDGLERGGGIGDERTDWVVFGDEGVWGFAPIEEVAWGAAEGEAEHFDVFGGEVFYAAVCEFEGGIASEAVIHKESDWFGDESIAKKTIQVEL